MTTPAEPAARPAIDTGMADENAEFEHWLIVSGHGFREWRDHVEQRLLTWRQRFVNRSGDSLALNDFMDKESLEDLIDFVCDEYTSPPDTPRPGWVPMTEAHIDAYLEDYEFGDEGYTPTEPERALIKDAIMGLLSARPQPPAEPKPKMRATPTSSRHDDGLEA